MKVADAFTQLANCGHARVADNQKICAAHYEPQVDRAAAFKFDTGIERFRSVIKSLSEIRSVKTHDSAESFSEQHARNRSRNRPTGFSHCSPPADRPIGVLGRLCAPVSNA